MERSSDLINDYIDDLKTSGEYHFPDTVKRKAQEFVAGLKQAGIDQVLAEYYRLMMLAQLSSDETEEEVARLDEILALAEQDEQLQFLIGEADYILSSRTGLLNPDALKNYERQQAWLSEHLTVSAPDSDLYRLLQRLRELGLYKGPIDGVLGKRSQKAVSQLQQSHAMPADGILTPQTLSILLPGVSYE